MYNCCFDKIEKVRNVLEQKEMAVEKTLKMDVFRGDVLYDMQP